MNKRMKLLKAEQHVLVCSYNIIVLYQQTLNTTASFLCSDNKIILTILMSDGIFAMEQQDFNHLAHPDR